MRIPIPFGIFKLVLYLLDLDPTDKDVDIGVGVAWGSHEVKAVVNVSWK